MEKKLRKRKSLYAIPCAFGTESYDDELFFVTFSTKDEVKALQLASCICGPEMADKALVIINEDGGIHQIF